MALEPVICSTEPVPGDPGLEIESTTSRGIGPAGHVAVLIAYDDAAGEGQQAVVITDESGANPQVAYTFDQSSVSGSPGVLSTASLPMFANDGSFAIFGSIDTGSEFLGTLMTGSPGNLTMVAQEDQPRPEIGEGFVINSLSNFSDWFYNPAGQIAYRLLARKGGLSRRVIWLGAPGSEQPVLQEDSHYPGMPPDTTIETLSSFRLAHNGDLFVKMEVRDDQNNDKWGVWHYSGGSLAPIAQQGESSPDGGTWDNDFSIIDAAGGWLLFSGDLLDGNRNYYAAEGTDVSLVLSDDLASAPGTGGAAFSGNNPSMYSEGISSTGRVVFTAFLEEGTGNPAVNYDNDKVLYSWEGNGLNLLLRSDESAPGFAGPQKIRNNFIPEMSSTGQVFLSGEVDDLYSSDVIWGESSPGTFTVVIKRDDTWTGPGGQERDIEFIDKSTGDGTNFNRSGFVSDGGVVTFYSLDSGIGLTTVNCVFTASIPPFILPGSISGAVRFDADGDGETSDDDAGIAGLTINLFEDDGNGAPTGGALLTTTTVGGTGAFSFNTVPPGDYVVEAVAGQEMLDRDHLWTLPPSLPAGALLQVSVNPAEDVMDVVFLSTNPGRITGLVEEDVNEDDSPDLPLPDVTVELRSAFDDELVFSTTTDSTGRFTFTMVPPGEYYLLEIDPLKYASVSDSEGANDNRISLTLQPDDVDDGHRFLDRNNAAYQVQLRRPVTATVFKQEALNASTEDAEPDYDLPLELVTSASSLGAQSLVTQGLMVDDVTPLIIEIKSQIDLPIGNSLRWTLDVESGGTVQDSIYSHAQVLSSGFWNPAVEPGPGVFNEVEIPAGNQTSGFLQISPMPPSALNFAGGSRRIELVLTLIDPTTENVLNTRTISLARPPIWIARDYDIAEEDISPDLINALLADRLFIGQVSDTGSVGSFRQGVQAHWAFTRMDLLAHGRRGYYRLLSNEPNAANFYRQTFRRAVSFGVPYRGSLLTPYVQRLNQRGIEIADANAVQTFLTFVPQTLSRVPTWKALAAGHSSSIGVADPSSGFYTAEIPPTITLNIATEIDPATSAAFRAIGLTGNRYHAVFGDNGSDGLVDGDSALAGDGLLLRGLKIAHGRPADLLGAAETQLGTDQFAQVILDVFNAEPGQVVAVPLELPPPVGVAKLAAVENLADDAPVSAVVEIIDLVTSQTAVSGKSGGPVILSSTQTQYQFGFTPDPGFPVMGDVFWFVELLGPDGPTTNGVTATPNGSDPTQVTVTVDEGLIGDVVLYLSYETTGDQIVFGVPEIIATFAPDGATLTGIELQPDGRTFDVGEPIIPNVLAIYSDGTEVPRALTPADLGAVTSSDTGVVDVTDPLAWEAVGDGSATVTLTAFGHTDSTGVTVTDPYPPKTKTEWKEENYTASELADPAISGDEADLDGDALSVDIEYLTGGVDDERDPMALPRIVRDETGMFFTTRVSTTLKDVFGLQILNTADLGTALAEWNVYFDFSDPIELADPRIADYRDHGPYLEIDFVMPPEANGQQFLTLRELAPPYGPVTGSTVLTFSGAGVDLGAYGDNVTQPTDGFFSYGGEPDYTPNITAEYTAGTAAGTVIDGSPINVLGSDSFGFISIILTAETGYLVELESFDVVVRANRATAPDVPNIQVKDAENVRVIDDTNVTVPVDQYLTYDLAESGPLISESVSIILNAFNLPDSERDDLGITNVRFSQREKTD